MENAESSEVAEVLGRLRSRSLSSKPPFTGRLNVDILHAAAKEGCICVGGAQYVCALGAPKGEGEKMVAFPSSRADRRHGIKRAFLAAVCMFAVVCSTALVACTDSDVGLPDTGTAPSEQESTAVLSFTVTSDDWDPAQDGGAIIKIMGQTDAGRAVSEQYVALETDEKYLTDLEAGEYDVSFTKMRTESTRIFKAETQHIRFDGAYDEDVAIFLSLDADAMARAEQEAAEKAAAEAAEKAAAEEAAREAEAARIAQEQAAAEAQRIAEEQAAAAAAAQDERTVYVASSGNGKKYHSNPSCSRMKGTIALTVGEAEARGYGPCSRCY